MKKNWTRDLKSERQATRNYLFFLLLRMPFFYWLFTAICNYIVRAEGTKGVCAREREERREKREHLHVVFIELRLKTRERMMTIELELGLLSRLGLSFDVYSIRILLSSSAMKMFSRWQYSLVSLRLFLKRANNLFLLLFFFALSQSFE